VAVLAGVCKKAKLNESNISEFCIGQRLTVIKLHGCNHFEKLLAIDCYDLLRFMSANAEAEFPLHGPVHYLGEFESEKNNSFA